MSSAGGVTSYVYNAFGQRVRKNVSGQSPTDFVYDDHGQLIGKYVADGQMIEQTVYLGSIPVAVLKTVVDADQAPTTAVYYIYPDHLDTPRVITRAADNAIVWRWDMADPFGMNAPLDNPGGLGKFLYNHRFPGQYYDRESGLHYNYFRDYDPQTGRYVQSDPIGLGGGINTYNYVGGNPVGNTDSRGLLVDTTGTYGVASAAGAATGTSAAVAGAAVGGAALVGVGIGMGINAGWERYAGQSIGGSIYDLLNPQMSEKQDRRDSHDAYKAYQRKGFERDPNDACQELRNRIAYLERLIANRMAHDTRFPNPRWPNGQRHAVVNAADQANLD